MIQIQKEVSIQVKFDYYIEELLHISIISSAHKDSRASYEEIKVEGSFLVICLAWPLTFK